MTHVRVFQDLNNDGRYERGEPYVWTDVNGHYTLRTTPGTYKVLVEVPAGYTPNGRGSRVVTVKNGHDRVNNVDFDLLSTAASPPTSTITSPTDTVVDAATWQDAITGTASDPDGEADLARVRVSVYDVTANRYWYIASEAVAPNRAWVSRSFVASNRPVYLIASGTTNWSLSMPGLALLDGHTYQITSQAVDREGHAEASPSSSTFTFSSPYAPPTLVLSASTTTVAPRQTVTFQVTIPRSVPGQPIPTGYVILHIDGVARAVRLIDGWASITVSLRRGAHVVTATYGGDDTYASLTSNAIRVAAR
jgi:hypothetical protein